MFIVKCRECCGEHNAEKVEFVNVEEDIQGRDIMHFVCPDTGTTTSSLVIGVPFEENDNYWTD